LCFVLCACQPFSFSKLKVQSTKLQPLNNQTFFILSTQMHLDPTLSEWLNLLFRWIHVFAGIMWVGTTYYFTWLDARLTEEEKAAANTGNPAQVWMVHSGGFYVVERRKVPDLVSRTLHWFKWEAGTTWLSGVALLIVVYYLGGGALVDPDVREISVAAAVGVGVGVIVVGWIVYDGLMLSPLGRNEVAFAVVAYILIVGLSFGLTSLLSARAAYIHVGRLSEPSWPRMCGCEFYPHNER
jgi:uncharacterized membrane protein